MVDVATDAVDEEAETEDPEDDAESPFLNAKGAVSSKWREYLLDVAFQARLLRKASQASCARSVGDANRARRANFGITKRPLAKRTVFGI